MSTTLVLEDMDVAYDLIKFLSYNWYEQKTTKLLKTKSNSYHCLRYSDDLVEINSQLNWTMLDKYF